MELFVDTAIIWLRPDASVACKDEWIHMILHEIVKCRDTSMTHMAIKKEDSCPIIFQKAENKVLCISIKELLGHAPLLVLSTQMFCEPARPTRNCGAVVLSRIFSPLHCLSLSSFSFAFILLLSVWIKSGVQAPLFTSFLQ